MNEVSSKEETGITKNPIVDVENLVVDITNRNKLFSKQMIRAVNEVSFQLFRGEALAAIAAVSEINLKTRLAEKDIGTEVALSGGDIQSVREAGVPLGTRFEIKNLFFQ